MKKIETYLSEDGQVFNDAASCVHHEFSTQPELLKAIEKAVANKPASHQLNWCSSRACACMGCINDEFNKLGLTQEHWKIWVNELREPTVEDSVDYFCNTNYQIRLKNINNQKTAFIKIVREHTKHTPQEILKLLSHENMDIINTKYYQDIKKIALQFKNAGIEVDVLREGEILEAPKKKMKM